MAASHQNHSQNHGANGFNGDGRNGGDRFPQPKPSTSGEVAEEPVASLQSLCFRGLFLCRDVLRWLVRRFSEVLGHQTPPAVRYALTDAKHATGSASVAACQPHPRSWYLLVPIRLLQAIASTGADLIEIYLDMRVPENQYYANLLRDLCDIFMAYEAVATHQPDSNIDPKQPSSYSALEPVPSPSSSVSSMSVYEEHSSEEAPAQPDPTGDRSVEQVNEQEEATEAVVKDEDKREKTEETEEKSEEKMEEGKAERLSTAVEEAVGAAVSMEKPQPQPEPQPQPPAAAPGECLVSTTPAAQPASSHDILAAEGPSQPTPGPIRSARRPAKTARFFNLFGSKKD